MMSALFLMFTEGHCFRLGWIPTRTFVTSIISHHISRLRCLSVAVSLQQVRLVIDGCNSAAIAESDTAQTSTEDRRACEAVSETPGEGRYLSISTPLQLGGRSDNHISYPPNVARRGFNGCIKNLVHNGQVCYSRSFSLCVLYLCIIAPFSATAINAFTLLDGRQGEHPICKN